MERIPEKVLKAYEASESYQKLKKIRNDNSKILQGYYRKYKDSLPYFKEEAAKKLDHERYGTGMTLPRGRLCPGNIEELIIGNVKRGRLVKEYVNPGYIYGYDKEDNLITSDMVEGEIRDREYIFWEEPQIQLGLKYWGVDLELAEITEAAYDEQGKIQRYLFGLMDGEKVDEIHIETYRYEGNKAFVTYIYSILIDGDYITGEHVVLDMNEQGKVLKYTGYTDMYPEEVYEGVPKHKLVL
ncbi:hypothetical protein E5329_05670 [Petralouisia muris]|uniref:Uncharacterized protein n=1 Tax=Petralouisia muris TaxID=3032872 RepID=A0AC61RZR1_9FIRM|nr:hypothetical protein [Petralouisia muris]TGY97167.1 hypothetical protein E5329_05670 [Petralouisia muris]